MIDKDSQNGEVSSGMSATLPPKKRSLRLRIGLLAALLALLLFGGYFLNLFAPEFLSPPPPLPGTPAEKLAAALQGTSPPLIFAHKGDHFLRAPDSMESVERAFRRNYDGAELDVGITSDGVLILEHSLDLEKGEKSVAVADLTYEELKKERSDLTRVEDILDRFGNRMLFILEIKSESLRSDGTGERLCELLKEKGVTDTVIVSSLDVMVIKRMSTGCPGANLMFEIVGPAHLVSSLLEKVYHYPLISIAQYNMDESFMFWALKHYRTVSVFTPYSDGELKEALERGARIIQTDRPGALARIRQSFLKRKE